MPPPLCAPSGKIIAQTLFLGASVASVNVSKGWSGQSSQLTVNLIEDDFVPDCGCNENDNQFATGQVTAHTFGSEDNHYETCTGTSCYNINTETDEYVTKGKVYYGFVAPDQQSGPNMTSGGFLSGYWKGPDPGFLGAKNRINTSRTHTPTTLNEPYDIIGTPVYFKMGKLTFGGIVQSWTKTQGSGGKGYSVVVNGMESILNECYIILNDFAGAVYAQKSSGSTVQTPSLWAGPKNYVGPNAIYNGSLLQGNVPNVFNVYGFLESFGKGYFGASNRNDNGIRVQDIVDALSVLTSCNNSAGVGAEVTGDTLQGFGNKQAFSPFGRIITKCMQTQNTYTPISSSFGVMGVIPPVANSISSNNGTHCEFVLDLSELPIFPQDYRLSEPVMSILDFINTITEEAGYDYHITLNPRYDNGNLVNVIKVHAISRLQQPRPNEISNTVNKMLCQQYYISNMTVGKERNETHAKKILIGGKQQRLYQAKSYRLAYSQSSFILNPTNFTFVDYMRLSSGLVRNATSSTGSTIPLYAHGKIKVPSFFHTRNLAVASGVNPNYSGLYNFEDTFFGSPTPGGPGGGPSGCPSFATLDPVWNDNVQLSTGNQDKKIGNLEVANLITQASDGSGVRFFPIYLDVICPFFGYVSDNEYTIATDSANNEFRRIRPVYYDTWTGQIVIVLQLHELPITNLNLQGFYTDRGIKSFTVTENEIRAALAGFDNFLVYILAKTYKNDLIEMLRRAYYAKYLAEYISTGRSNPARLAKEKTDWYWRLLGGNIAGPYNQPIFAVPDKGDGQAYIEEEVMQDLKIIHGFVSTIGAFYGKKYMVAAPFVRSYKDEQYADIALSGGGNDIFVFQGGGKLYYNYEPTNDGAWEEFDNFIDDCIRVGGDEWYNLTDDTGKIKPILGYNASLVLDYHRFNLCKMSQDRLDLYAKNGKNDPFWNFDAYDYIKSLRDGNCDGSKFIFEGLNLSSMNASDYNLIKVSGTITKSAFNKVLPSGGWMKKLYLNTSIEEGFCFLDPVRMTGPKIIIDSPGLTLNSVSDEVAKDPNRTVISNVAVEDLSLYLKTGGSDPNFIRFMAYYISHIHGEGSNNDSLENGEMFGSYAASANQAANFVQIAPKAAHPFFAAIPIRSNRFTYGPWTNFPYMYQHQLFPSGVDISTDKSLPPVCSSTAIVPTLAQAQSAINNMIGSVKVEIDEDLVPWNYGGMAFLDLVAFSGAEKDLNYQSVIETAQIDMPGLPLFDLGMGFTFGNLTPTFCDISQSGYSYTDYKDNALPLSFNTLPGITGSMPTGLLANISTTTTNLTYNIYNITGLGYYSSGPIVTNIQLSIGQQGLTTTYTFRTYTPKVGLFNKVVQDKVKRNFKDGFKRNKTLSRISQQSKNIGDVQSRFLIEQKMVSARLDGDTFRSQLFGWSPSTVLIAQASPYISMLDTNPPYIEPTGLYSAPTGVLPTPNPPTSRSFVTPDSTDTGITGVFSLDRLSDAVRYRTNVGMYETKEIPAQIKKDYGLQSMMSLDGIFSPVSFYPTLKNSTFSLGLYNTNLCPFCKKSKQILIDFATYSSAGVSQVTGIPIFCNKCGRLNDNRIDNLSSTATTTAGTQSIETLPPYIISSGTDISILQNFKLLAGVSSASTTSAASTSQSNNTGGGAGVSIPINMTTLNPIVVPYGNLSNTNVQHYTGNHPENAHSGLGDSRTFIDRSRHSIEIVGRGAVQPKILDIHTNMNKALINRRNADYCQYDLLLADKLGSGTYVNNQRFIGLKGPIVMHSWGYDLEGYPVPNAADEPHTVDSYNQPARFALKIKDGYPKSIKFKELEYGAIFVSGGMEYAKKNNFVIDTSGNKLLSSSFNGDISVSGYAYEDDLAGGTGIFTGTAGADLSTDRTTGFQGSIVSKTQKLDGGKWTPKKKLKEFYLNWAERPDLWPVGPIDLRWDAGRRVWTIKSSDAATIYKMVYVTLEEDLVKDDDVDDTYPARGFLDDLEYSTEPLGSGLRRLVFVKDRAGYTAPRGAKLLCRYDKDTGFYEPVSKSAFIAKGVISPGTNTATIEMSYAPGKKKGEPYPTMIINFDNPFDLPTTENKGLFTFLNSKWLLTTSK